MHDWFLLLIGKQKIFYINGWKIYEIYTHIFYLTIQTNNMYGGGFGGYGGGFGEMQSDMWINSHVPGGVNSKLFYFTRTCFIFCFI